MASSDKLAILVYLQEIKVFPKVSNLLSIFAIFIFGVVHKLKPMESKPFSFNHCCKKN